MKTKEREIIERLANAGLEELKELQEAARALVKPEPDYSSWIGGAVEVRDSEDNQWCKTILEDYSSDKKYPFVVGTGGHWPHCRPLSEPLQAIYTPHDPHVDAQPVPDDEWVLVRLRSGRVAFCVAGEFNWGPRQQAFREIVGFMRIKP